MMYHPIKFGWEKISTSVDNVETVISHHISPHYDHDLENSKPIFSYNTLAHGAASPYQARLQKVEEISSRWTFTEIWSLCCYCDLEHNKN